MGLAIPAIASARWALDSTTGNYEWFDPGGHANPYEVTPAQYQQMVNDWVTSADQLTGQTVPSDLVANEPVANAVDATVGTGGDAGAGIGQLTSGVWQSLKNLVPDALAGTGDWTAFSSVGPVALLAAGTAYVGWQIGSAIDQILNPDQGTVVSGGSYTESRVVPISAGQSFLTVAGVTCSPTTGVSSQTDAYSGGTGTCYSPTAPTDGWIVEAGSVSAQREGSWGAFAGDCGAASEQPATYSQMPGGATFELTFLISQVGAFGGCTVNGQQITADWTGQVGFWYLPATEYADPGYGTSQGNVTTTTNSLTPPSEATAKTNAATVFASSSNDTLTRLVCQADPTNCGTGASTIGTPGQITIPAPTPATITFPAYKNELQTAGFTGPITQSVLSDVATDPAVGPDQISHDSPAWGSSVAADTSITVYTNPDDAPVTSPAGGTAPGPLTPPGVTLPSVTTPCNVFPFGIPCWVVSQLGALVSTAAVAPSWSMGMPTFICGSGCALNVNLASPFGLDLTGIMAVVRPVLLFLSFLGLMYWLGTVAMGGSYSGGGSSEADE